MISPLQKRELMRMLDRDLREEISVVKRLGYEHALRQTTSLVSIGDIERQVRIDSRLTQGDRSLLLSAVSRMLHLQTPSTVKTTSLD